MNGEQISAALEFLDEDLVACTDEVRRGKRRFFRPTLRWAAAAAACAAVVMAGAIFFPPMVSEDSTMNGMIQDPEYSANSNSGVSIDEQGGATSLWREVSVNSIILSAPLDGDAEQEEMDGDGGYHIALEHEGRVLTVGYNPGFAVCGTGLEEKSVTVAGMEASAGYYDGNELWSFITLGNDYVVINQAGDAWTREEQDEINAILGTIVCHPHREKHDADAGEDHPHTEGHHSSEKHH